MGLLDLTKLEASLRLQVHELSDAFGFSDGWCVHDTLSMPELHYPQEKGKWGGVTSRPSFIAAATPLGLPLSAPVAYADGRNLVFELFDQGKTVLSEPLNQTELRLLHEIAQAESLKLHADQFLDFPSIIARVREVAQGIDQSST